MHVTAEMDRESHCMQCHASCGQCHVSRPGTVGNGLPAGHFIQKRPPMKETCTACHGSRIDREFFGKNEGVPPDIHRGKYFKCGKCHSAEEMHGDGNMYTSRYELGNRARCTSCHEAIFTDSTGNFVQHVLHQDKVSCQVCHVMPYKNCYSCHVGKDTNGLNYFKVEPSVIDFKIGLSPKRSEDRPEKYVVVRHVPVDRDLFSFYVEGVFDNFDSAPTWKPATPHTIRRSTPQNSDCNNCHGNRELFLQPGDVRSEYMGANIPVIVPDDMIPAKMGD